MTGFIRWSGVIVMLATFVSPAATQVRGGTRAANPPSLEQQVAELQSVVNELRAQVDSLKSQLALEPGDYVVTGRSPSPGFVCAGVGLASPNSILGRTKFVKYEEFPEGVVYVQWSDCRRR